jgi:hypothetical protein
MHRHSLFGGPKHKRQITMTTETLFCRPRRFQRVGNIIKTGLQIAICILAVALTPLAARAGWPWFSGYINPTNSYRIYAWTDWDGPLWGAAIYPDSDCLGNPPPDHRVDGHVVYRADGTGYCVVIESTGSYSSYADTAVGSIHPVSVQFGGWWQSPGSPPASDTRHDWSSEFLNIVSDPVPTLNLTLTSTNCSFFWPTNVPGYSLQSSTNLLAGSWSDVTNQAVMVGTDFSVTLSATPVTWFFRLKK